MNHTVRTATAAAVISVSGIAGSTASAEAYNVDCAILLCLAGGWPASAPCAHAKGVFIHRITPWPIEPPLQIWRCPMGVSFNSRAPLSSMGLIHGITFRDKPVLSVPLGLLPTKLLRAGNTDHVDTLGDTLDLVRGIRVFHIQYHQNETENSSCRIRDQTLLGEYNIRGEFHWHASSAGAAPKIGKFNIPDKCESYSYRGVIADWRDYQGIYCFEEIRY